MAAIASPATKPLSVKLEPETRARIEALAQARDRSTHWMMREAILQYVTREEKRDAFRNETLAAWDEFQETGLHASAAEVETWLSSWGTENALDAPQCRN